MSVRRPRRWRAAAAHLLAGLAAAAGAAAIVAVAGVPRPVYHDELSHLLAADTLARGRLTNPTHPHWEHFESFHVLQRPSYASKYPPGQGLLLAAGALAGAPIAGVWLGVFAMCAVASWMLHAFVPLRWAVLGGLLAGVQLGGLTYWGQGYWGGALAATGGALVFGAVGRILRTPGGAQAPGRRGEPARRARRLARLGFVLGCGLVVLVVTRPFEGALVSLAGAGALGAWSWRRRSRGEAWIGAALATAAPVVAALALGATGLLLYNRAVTGDPMLAPYTAHDRQYLATPAFLFQDRPPTPEYRHELHRRFYVDYLVGAFEAQRSWSGWAEVRADRLARSWRVLLGPVLGLLVVAGLLTRRARGIGMARAGVALFLVAVALTTSHHPHYAAPLVPLLLLAAVQGARWLVLRAHVAPRRHALAIALLVLAALAARLALPDPVLRVGAARSANRAKEAVERHLVSLGGEHLVFVRHGRFADIHDEWVANGADIDGGRIVWARAMSPAEDAELIAYYERRRVWRVEIAAERPGLVDFVELAGPRSSEAPSTPAGAAAPTAATAP